MGGRKQKQHGLAPPLPILGLKTKRKEKKKEKQGGMSPQVSFTITQASQYLRGLSGYWQLVHIALVLLDPGRIDQAIPGGIQVLVSTTDRPITYVNNLGDLLRALALAHQVGGHVDAGCHNG